MDVLQRAGITISGKFYYLFFFNRLLLKVTHCTLLLMGWLVTYLILVRGDQCFQSRELVRQTFVQQKISNKKTNGVMWVGGTGGGIWEWGLEDCGYRGCLKKKVKENLFLFKFIFIQIFSACGLSLRFAKTNIFTFCVYVVCFLFCVFE